MLQSAFFDKIFDKNCLFSTQYENAKNLLQDAKNS